MACALVGWFILLTSLLSFWRVKRWERGILSPQHPAASRTADESVRDQAVIANLEDVFGFRMLARGDLRTGLGFGNRTRDSEREYMVHETDAAGRMDGSEREPIMSIEGESDEDRERRANDRRLTDALQASGFL